MAGEEARAAANGLIDAAEAIHNPFALANALYGYGYAFGDADPVRALEALRRGLVIAQDSGNRLIESHAGDELCLGLRPNTATRWRRSITSLWPSATSTTLATSPTSVSPWPLSRCSLDRLGRLEPAATIAGFAFSPLAAAAVPELTTAIAHLRDVLGDQTYESLARKGETMTTAAMAAYAYDQIDQARAELNAVSK